MENQKLSQIASKIRRDTLNMIVSAGSGHIGSAYSITDILVTLYYEKMNLEGPYRDRLVLSKGHCVPALYAILSDKGLMPKDEIKNFRQFGSAYQGHPDSKLCPWIDISTGSLGQGLSAAVGMALGYKRQGIDSKVYVICGDGELQEGICYEAFMAASAYKLDNLTVIVDYNKLQLSGAVDCIMPLLNLSKKIREFGFFVSECDGHDFDQIRKVLDEKEEGKPHCIIAHTIKGKGVSFMEGDYSWHGRVPKGDEIEKALKELGGEYGN